MRLSILFALLISVGSTISFAKNLAAGMYGELEIWGGDHLRMTIDGDVARLDFDCASAEFPWHPEHGRIDAEGTYLQGSGIPFPPGQEPKPEPARFVGKIRGKTLKLTVETTSSSATEYKLVRGSEGKVTHCL